MPRGCRGGVTVERAASTAARARRAGRAGRGPARLNEHPAASTAIAAVSWTVLAVALVTQVPNAVNGLANIAAGLGLPLGFALPTFAFPAWLDVLLSVLGLAAALDRGLRMVHNPLLDD